MRGIALHYCLAGVHPRQRLPGSRIKCGMTVRCAAVPLRLSVRPPFFYSVIPASEPESWVALCVVLRCVVVIPRRRLPGSRIKCGMTAYCAVVPSRSLCTAARTPTVSFRPPSRNPGQPYVRYCVALLPRRCPSPPTPPRVPHQVRDDGAMRRCTIAPLCMAAFFYSVIPASEPESWAALCAVLRCTIASPVSIPANASQGPASSAG